MDKVTISPKFQVVIPRSIRERLDLKAGQQVQVVPYDDRIELIPVRPARKLRGFLRGISTELEREEDRLGTVLPLRSARTWSIPPAGSSTLPMA